MIDDLIMNYKDYDETTLKQEVLAIVDFFESRIISHADAEEEAQGFYSEVVAENPEKAESVTQLKRDHDIMRQIIAQVKHQIEQGFSTNIFDYFRSIIIVNEIHSRDEERLLLQ
ncbi:hemerythrin domain-containing protein [Macrococcoides canis]|uniref:Hemerythrin-like domain-containing protein n=2 Tax=Macrococcoides canis TaxID=1855823 RepID=A0A4R6C523_9STAP|nr:hemerythrin domain-containing protein [Macrococcus canis]MEE1106819.1 hypothetical protein [Macrococcus canis]TDM16954.1 hypothetical protein ETI04_07065 [Macrococcus canis]TDM20253.1 hypothetical protein ETI05_07540 [Macrococcus canis]TDM22956.1 hypothetical protein ETI02_07390 [Macrococcus canis]TDM33692.1 hypothetical protein ETI13_06925 [Macrococcus canis]